MATEVIKKDGSKVAFDASKIRSVIRAAGVGANLPEERIEELVKEVGNVVIDAAEKSETVSTREIRAMALDELDRIAPQVSAGWRAYDAKKE